MDRKRVANDEPEVSELQNKRKKVIDSVKERKIQRLVVLYKRIDAEIKKLDGREVSLSDEYNEEEELRLIRRREILSKKHLAIFKYLAKKGILVGEDNQKLDEDIRQDKRIRITNTGIERLNDLLTDFINQPGDKEGPLGVLGKHRHVTYEDVKNLVEELRSGNEGVMIPTDPLEYDTFITNVAVVANKEVKNYLEEKHKMALNELWLSNDTQSSDLQKLDQQTMEGESSKPLSWENANMALSKACANGELTAETTESEEFETDIPCTAEELDEEEDEVDEEAERLVMKSLEDLDNTCRDGSEDRVKSVDGEGNDTSIECLQEVDERSGSAISSGLQAESALGVDQVMKSDVVKEKTVVQTEIKSRVLCEKSLDKFRESEENEMTSKKKNAVASNELEIRADYDNESLLNDEDFEVVDSSEEDADDAEVGESAASSPVVISLSSEDSDSSSIIVLD